MISQSDLKISAAAYYSRHLLDLKRSSGKAMVMCVFHQEKTGSLQVDLDTGLFYCFGCGKHGDMVDFHRTLFDLDFKTAYQELSDGIQSIRVKAPMQQRRKITDEGKIAKARQIWHQGIAIQSGDVVDRYLTGRSICLDQMPDCLRLHPALDYWEQREDGRWKSRGQFPAMLARVDASDGNMVAVHRTYLITKGQKANVPSARKVMGGIEGGAIRLCQPGKTLAVAEGIETALAYHQLTGLPVWACISSSGMGRIELPPTVTEVFICVDMDPNGTGEKAAQTLATRILGGSRKVQMARPPVSASGLKKDWNDYLQEQRTT